MKRYLALILFLTCLSGAQAEEPKMQSVTILAQDKLIKLEKALVADGELWTPVESLPQINGFTLKAEGICRDDVCIPLPGDGSWITQREGTRYLNVTALARKLDQQVVSNDAERVWSFSAVPTPQGLTTGVAPDFSLPDSNGKQHKLSDYRGKKILLLTWASW